MPPFAPFSSALGTLRGPPRRGAPGGQRAFTTTSTTSIVTAFGVSSLIGVVFGYLPARNAAQLDPVEALARP